MPNELKICTKISFSGLKMLNFKRVTATCLQSK